MERKNKHLIFFQSNPSIRPLWSLDTPQNWTLRKGGKKKPITGKKSHMKSYLKFANGHVIDSANMQKKLSDLIYQNVTFWACHENIYACIWLAYKWWLVLLQYFSSTWLNLLKYFAGPHPDCRLPNRPWSRLCCLSTTVFDCCSSSVALGSYSYTNTKNIIH